MLDRDLQRTLLQRLADQYPNRVDVQQWNREFATATVQLAYLAEHGLCTVDMSRGIAVQQHAAFARATARGMDFLADDGGLSAILGVVTVRLHDDTLKALLTAKIEQSDLPAPEKTRLLDKIKELPGEALSHLSMKLIDLGLEKSPAAIEAITEFIKSLGR